MDKKKQLSDNEYLLTGKDLQEIADSLDETGGMLIKDSELRFWIAEHVRRDRANQKTLTTLTTLSELPTDASLNIVKERLDSLTVKPYHTFSIKEYPFRWVFVYVLWNIGAGLRTIGKWSKTNKRSVR